ncbi:MAG: tetratricopeptide repeat protein, partial [Planctomycetota bacterium]
MPRLRAPAGLLLLVAWLPAQDREDFRVGLGLQERGLHREAAKAFERFVAASPEAAEATEAWYRLGVCREELSKAADACKAYEAMLKGDAEFRHRAEGRFRLGRLLQAAGKQAEAVAQMEALLQEAGQRHYLAPAACFAIGECREARGEKAEALAAYDRTAALAPKGELAFPALYKAGHLALAADDPLAAATRFGRAADGFPDHEAATECRYLQGLALVRGGRDRQAEAVFARVTEGPWADDAMLALADCLDRRGDADGALRVLAELRRRHPDSPLGARALERTAFARLQAGKGDEAATLFDQALAALGRDAAAAPARSRCLYGLAEARVALGKDAEAVDAYAEAEKLSTDPALRGDAAYGALFALHRLGRHRESLRIAKAFAGEYPGHRLALQAGFAVAENLWALEDWAGARAGYAEAATAAQAAAAVAGAEPAAAASARALADQCAYKVAWCDWLREQPADAAAG